MKHLWINHTCEFARDGVLGFVWVSCFKWSNVVPSSVWAYRSDGNCLNGTGSSWWNFFSSLSRVRASLSSSVSGRRRGPCSLFSDPKEWSDSISPKSRRIVSSIVISSVEGVLDSQDVHDKRTFTSKVFLIWKWKLSSWKYSQRKWISWKIIIT